jgi:hypothetical protein
MEERTTRTSVTFSRPFSLTGIEASQPVGVYRIEMVDVLLDNAPYLSPAYRRISATIELPAVGASSPQRQSSAMSSKPRSSKMRPAKVNPHTGHTNEF